MQRAWRLWEEKTGLTTEPLTEDLVAELVQRGYDHYDIDHLVVTDARYVRSQDRWIEGWDMTGELFAWGLLP